MTPPGKRTSAQVWDALERADDEAELSRIDAMSDAAVDAELRAHGIAPEAAPSIGPASRRASTRRWVKWLALAAAIALVLGALARRREIQARFEPRVIEKDREVPAREPTPPERAARLREDAFGLCEQEQWTLCDARLNAARDLDPAGEADPRVGAARRAVASARIPWDAHARDEKPHR